MEMKTESTRPVWKGAISFGLVSIPVSLFSAVRREELKFTDDYRATLEKMIEEKIEHGGKKAPEAVKKPRPSNIIDLVSVLQQSIKETQSKSRQTRKSGPDKKAA